MKSVDEIDDISTSLQNERATIEHGILSKLSSAGAIQLLINTSRTIKKSQKSIAIHSILDRNISSVLRQYQI
jgi:hypothetical protein